MVEKSIHLQIIPQQSTQNSKFGITYIRKNQWTFLLFNTSFDFSSSNNFANSDSFAKVFVSVHNYGSWVQQSKYLGVILQSDLKFSSHIQLKVSKAK